MKRLFACLMICFACGLTIGCTGGDETEVMPEPTAEEQQEIMDYEMNQEDEMNDPANR